MANDEGGTSLSQTKFSYDVFLSFRGEDTRHGFTGNLEKALSKARIHTFMDDKELRVGEQIGPALLRAIEESKIAIIVFSKKYADSSWCLDEFAEIIQCHKDKSQIAYSIFYNVKPSDYGQAMTEHEKKFGTKSEKVIRWKSSLAEVASFKEYHIKGEEYKLYKDMIQDIVRDVSNEVSPRRLDINEHIVGLEDRVKVLKSNLGIESKDTTCFLGIHGISGIGKTTLAKVLYNSICHEFEDSRFLLNDEGQKLLLQTLLTEMFNEETSVDEETKPMQKRLLVLDDVDDIKLLDVLAEGRDWFGPRSKIVIIITTRDKHLLDALKVEKRYEMGVLNDHDSMKLFCHYAFEKNCPPIEYEEMSNRAVRCAKGLPLALKDLGSHLIGKDLDVWKSALDKYEKRSKCS